MSSRRLVPVLALLALGSTGCIEAIKITGALLEVAATAAVSRGGSPSGGGSSSNCCYARENPTPVEGAVDRPMSECELSRGRWRETHQGEDEVPPHLQCLADGSYPAVPPSAAVLDAAASPATASVGTPPRPPPPPAAEPSEGGAI